MGNLVSVACEGRYGVCSKKKEINAESVLSSQGVAKLVLTGASEMKHRALPCTGRRTNSPSWG